MNFKKGFNMAADIMRPFFFNLEPFMDYSKSGGPKILLSKQELTAKTL